MADVYSADLIQLQNLRSSLETEKAAKSNNLDLDLGTTEYVLISLWLAFTTGVFGLLYKITKEADDTCEEQTRLTQEKKRSGIQFGQVNSNGYQELV